MGLEGVVAKRVNSLYRRGSARAMVKLKNMAAQELIVAGYNALGSTRGYDRFALAWILRC